MSSDLGARAAQQKAAPAPTPDLGTLAPDAVPSDSEGTGRLGSVFWTSVALSTVVVLWGVLFSENLSTVTTASLDWLTESFGWTYLVVTLGLLVFLVLLAFSPTGDIRLGRPHADRRPVRPAEHRDRDLDALPGHHRGPGGRLLEGPHRGPAGGCRGHSPDLTGRRPDAVGVDLRGECRRPGGRGPNADRPVHHPNPPGHHSPWRIR